MSGDWKPGDVAMVRCADLSDRVAIRKAGNSMLEPKWATKDGDWGDAVAYDPRPLVVIDPEDAEGVKRLADAFCHARWSHIEGSDECDPLTRTSMQSALREFATPTPPRPDEPLGLGAVVEDAEGHRWIRHAGMFALPWYRANASSRTWAELDIPADGVLSEGVPA